MRFSSTAILLLAVIYHATAQLLTKTIAQTGLTATGATILATGATVTFTPEFTTVTLSLGAATTITIQAPTSLGNALSSGLLSVSSKGYISVSFFFAEVSAPTSTISNNDLPAQTTGASSGTAFCSIPANPDLIGLGIRLGIYFQLSANVIIALVKPNEGISSLTVSNIFFTGNLIALVYSVAQNNVPPSVMVSAMWFLVMDINLAFPIFMISLSAEKDEVYLSSLTVSFIGLRWVASNSLNIWFWFHGLNIQNPLQCMEPRVFLFANLGAYGNVRTAFKVFSVLLGVLSLVILGWIFADLYHRLFHGTGKFADRFEIGNPKPAKVPEETGEGTSELPAQVSDAEAADKDMKNFIFIIAGIFILILTLAPAVAGIELQIRWNNLTGLDNFSSVGQIVPLTIGCFGLFRAVVLSLFGLTGL
jgi:hypothetical protein